MFGWIAPRFCAIPPTTATSRWRGGAIPSARGGWSSRRSASREDAPLRQLANTEGQIVSYGSRAVLLKGREAG